MRWLMFFFAAGVLATGASGAERPNVLWILADDLGYGDIGCYGSKTVLTPNLDRLAAEGARLTSFYASAPVCSPTRGALLTGRDPQGNGLTNVIETTDHVTGLSREMTLIAQPLKAAGYTTAIFGKWHVGENAGYRPTERGFDHFFGNLLGGFDFFAHDFVDGRADLWENTTPIRRDGQYATDLLADEAVKFIGEHRGEPLFIYLAFEAVHTSLGSRTKGKIQSPPRWLERYGAKKADGSDLPQEKVYAACVSAMDEAVGKVLAAIDEAGLREKTLVMFTSDNGPEPGAGGTGGPCRGTKHEMWEGGIRVPMIARWSGHIPVGAVRDTPRITVDWFPTTLAATGVDLPRGLRLDGRDLMPLLVRGEAGPERDLYWSYIRDTLRVSREKAVRRGRWKWLNGELYDLAADGGESRDVAKEQPKVAAELEAAWKAWATQYPEEINRWGDREPLRHVAKKKTSK